MASGSVPIGVSQDLLDVFPGCRPPRLTQSRCLLLSFWLCWIVLRKNNHPLKVHFWGLRDDLRLKAHDGIDLQAMSSYSRHLALASVLMAREILQELKKCQNSSAVSLCQSHYFWVMINILSLDSQDLVSYHLTHLLIGM
jgi:hypothetical protein